MNVYDKIMELDDKSSLSSIKKCLFYDYKQDAPDIYKEEYNKEKYKYNPKDSNLINYLRYKILVTSGNNAYKRINVDDFIDKNERNLFVTPKYGFDCDCCPNVMYILYKLLEKNGIEVTEIDIRTFMNGKKTLLDTDTYNSVMHIYSKCRKYFKLKRNIEDNLDKLLSNNIKKLNEKEKILYSALNDFCLYSYTIGNFVFIPKGYNANRWNNVNDYPDFSIIDLQKENIKEEKCEIDNESLEWYRKNIRKLYMDRYIENINYKDFNSIKSKKFLNTEYNDYEKLNKVLSDNIDFLITYITNINKVIILRGIDILCSLNPKLNKNKELSNYRIKLEQD